MFTSRPRVLIASALCAATIAGCGDSSKDEATATSTTPAATPTPTSPASAANATPTQKWARAVCDTVGKAGKSVQPPIVAGTTPEESKRSIVAFFTAISSQLGVQADALRKAGPPPGANGKREYGDALDKLATVERAVGQTMRRLDGQDVSTKDELKQATDQVGKQLADLQGYQGPIAQLAATKSLGSELQAEPACAALGSATPTAG